MHARMQSHALRLVSVVSRRWRGASALDARVWGRHPTPESPVAVVQQAMARERRHAGLRVGMVF